MQFIFSYCNSWTLLQKTQYVICYWYLWPYLHYSYFLLKRVKNKYKRIVRTDLSLHLSGGGGWIGIGGGLVLSITLPGWKWIPLRPCSTVIFFWFPPCSLCPLEDIKPLTCWFTRTRVWNILHCSNTVGVKCSPLLAILTGLWASAQTCLLLHSVTVTLQVNKTDGSAQVFLEGTNAMIKDKLLRMG